MKNYWVFSVWLTLAVPLCVRGADVALVNGQNAENVAGQTDSGGQPVLTEVGPYDSALLDGLGYPTAVEIDTTTHRLFVAEYQTNRVTVFDLDLTDNLQDYSPDYVLGQPDFYSDKIAVGNDRLNTPRGMAMDPTTQRLFVADTNNHRVMVFDVSMLTNGENAINVLGQPNFTSNSAGNTANGINGSRGVCIDPGTQKLYVSNSGNHRVTVYDVSAITDGENAVNVLGQTTFTGTGAGTSTGKLNGPRHCAVDETRDLLYVADYSNNRVMVFDVATITNGEVAVNVLGQPNFAANNAATTQNGLFNPVGVELNTAGNTLFVSDYTNNRVLLFDVASITNGENATHVIGQPNFTSAQPVVSAAGMSSPWGILSHPVNGKTIVADYGSNRVLLFEGAWQTGMNAIDVLGQRVGNAPSFTSTNLFSGNNSAGYYWPYDVELDLNRHRLFVADLFTCRVLVYDLDSSNTLVNFEVDHVLGQPDMTTSGKKPPASNTLNPTGLALDREMDRLFVADGANNRVMVFDTEAITDGKMPLWCWDKRILLQHKP